MTYNIIKVQIKLYFMFIISVDCEEDFQQILKEAGIHDVLLMGNTSLLQAIALLLHDWKTLARYLKLDEPTIRQIQEDNKDDFDEQKYQCLYKWVQLNGKDATLVNLLWVVYSRLKDKLLIHQIAQCLQGLVHVFYYKHSILIPYPDFSIPYIAYYLQWKTFYFFVDCFASVKDFLREY